MTGRLASRSTSGAMVMSLSSGPAMVCHSSSRRRPGFSIHSARCAPRVPGSGLSTVLPCGSRGSCGARDDPPGQISEEAVGKPPRRLVMSAMRKPVAAVGVKLPCGVMPGVVRFERTVEIDAGEAVDLDVDEAGRDPGDRGISSLRREILPKRGPSTCTSQISPERARGGDFHEENSRFIGPSS